ncbi:MAG: hypothetical protein PWP72_136 [Thermoanaerobacter sp.]|jgi:hypothetical protein|nr:hypothetical protein [Thermoanaerobacter sp.]
MLTWEQVRRYHSNQRGIHQRQGQILSIEISEKVRLSKLST